MNKKYDEEITDKILQELKPFNGLDLNEPTIVIGINAIALKSLLDVQSMYSGFDGDVSFDYDPDPFLKISWWHGMTGTGDELIFRFNPLRRETDDSEVIAAYERAMSII